MSAEVNPVAHWFGEEAFSVRRFAAFLVAILLVVAVTSGGRPAVSPAETVLQGTDNADRAPAGALTDPPAEPAGPHGRVTEVEVWEFRDPGEVEHHLSAGNHEIVVASDAVSHWFTLTDANDLPLFHVEAPASVDVWNSESSAFFHVELKEKETVVVAGLPGQDPVRLKLRRVDAPTATMHLEGAPHLAWEHLFLVDYFPWVSPGPQTLRIELSQPADRESVEAALLRNLARGYGADSPADPPQLEFDWQDDRNLTVRFTVQPAQRGVFAFMLDGVVADNGAYFADATGLAFEAGDLVHVWSWEPGGAPRDTGRAIGQGGISVGTISLDGRFIAFSEPAFWAGDGWNTAAWVVDLQTGNRTYLGDYSDNVVWVEHGLLIHEYGGWKARLVPWQALRSAEPAAAAEVLGPGKAWAAVDRPDTDEARMEQQEARDRARDVTVEPNGSRIVFWTTPDPDVPRPMMELHVQDPTGDWDLSDLVQDHESRGTHILFEIYPDREPAAFGPDGSLYWLERKDAGQTSRLWRLSRQGKQVVLEDVQEPDQNVLFNHTLQWAGDELLIASAHLLLNPVTGARREVPYVRESLEEAYWVSPDGRWLALSGWDQDDHQQGYLYRLDDLSEVGRWAGRGYGFDKTGVFYFGVPENWDKPGSQEGEGVAP